MCFFSSCYPTQSYFISARHSLLTHSSSPSLSAICVVSCYFNNGSERNRSADLVRFVVFFFSFRRFVLLACPFSILRISYLWWNQVRKIEFRNRFVCISLVPAKISVGCNSLLCLAHAHRIYISVIQFFGGRGGGREVCALVFLALPVC